MDETGGRHEQICRSLASLVVQREMLDSALARGEEVDVDALIRLTGAISRLMGRAGLVADDDDVREPVDMTEEALRRMDAL